MLRNKVLKYLGIVKNALVILVREGRIRVDKSIRNRYEYNEQDVIDYKNNPSGKYKCSECILSTDYLNTLPNYYKKSHNLDSEDLYVILFHGGIHPTCRCGCGANLTFSTITRGFESPYVKNHHFAESTPKRVAALKERYANGELEAWAKGKTKDTDERLAYIGRKVSESFTIEKRKEYSERMSELVMKGGVSTIKDLYETKLYWRWKKPILDKNGYKCQECEMVGGKLHVHHDKERMHEIVAKFLPIEKEERINLSFEKRQEAANKVIEYHLDNNVSGVILCEDCHRSLHHDEGYKRK